MDMDEKAPPTPEARPPLRFLGVRVWTEADDALHERQQAVGPGIDDLLPLIAEPIELEEGVDPAEALEDARWQTMVSGSLVRSIGEEIEHVESAPELDERELERLRQDYEEWSLLYLQSALDAARILEQIRRAGEPAETPPFSLPVAPAGTAQVMQTGSASPLAR